MKIRNGFVSNSSSSSFLITNKSNKDKTLIDFVEEVGRQILVEYTKSYDWYANDGETTYPNLLVDAIKETCMSYRKDWNIPANKNTEWTFGDEDGTVLGRVFDYGLRDGGETENFTWIMTDCRGSAAFAELYDYSDDEN